MGPDRIGALALHVCADVPTRGLRHQYPPSIVAPDTVRRAGAICRQLGIRVQRRLDRERATADALIEELRRGGAALADDGSLVLTFSGHTERGDGPIETARWCLSGGGVELSTIAGELGRLPARARLLLLSDTCYAAAITRVIDGPQEVVVIGSCADDQTMLERRSSEFMVKLERFALERPRGTLEELRVLLEDDTPDCERPFAWTNVASRWSAEALSVARPLHRWSLPRGDRTTPAGDRSDDAL
jgi:hypothetical protein